MKACSKCGAVKSLDEFHRQTSKKDGRRAQCKVCCCSATLAFYHRNRKHFLDYAKQYMKQPRNRARSNGLRKQRHLKDPRRRILTDAKGRAQRSGVPFDLKLDDISIPSHCPALGILLHSGGGKRQKDCSPTLDRIIPGLGYVRGNVAVVSWRANRLKSDATIADLEGVLAYYRSALAVAVTFADTRLRSAA